MTKFECSHCEHVFEAENQEGLECPRCFWSSSVNRYSGEKKAPSPAPAKVKAEPQEKSRVSVPWIPIWTGVIFFVVTVAIAVLIWMFGARLQSVLSKRFQPVKQEQSEIKKSSAKEGAPEKIAPAVDLPILKPEEQSILDRRFEFLSDRSPSDDEQKILQAQVSFSTGMKETLPSKIWTEQDFEKLLEEQQQIYRVPIAWSYRRKLKSIFKTSYLAAEKAFSEGELLRARDLWIQSLSFPIYGNDIRLHRGVILTMLRPYVNDTLSKIGAIHSELSEKAIRSKEAEVLQSYQGLGAAIGKKDWTNAREILDWLDKMMGELERPQMLAGPIPPYPSAIQQVDEGIRATLAGLLEVPPAPVSAMQGLYQDLQAKRRVIESFDPAVLERAQRKYQEATEALDRKDFALAEKLLREINSPLALAQDASEKMKVLRKLNAQTVAATPQTEPVQNTGSVKVVAIKKGTKQPI